MKFPTLRIIAISSILLSFTVKAQDKSDLTTVSFYPPSAVSLMKYVDYPVSPMTGQPNITIPLYTIKSGNLELPIALTFHIADFARANQLPGCVGAGWSLSCDKQVARRINGLDDFSPEGYYHTALWGVDTSDVVPSPSDDEILNLWKRYKDGEPDKFFYSTIDGDGAFYLPRGEAVGRNVPFSGDNIRYINDFDMSFKITDSRGNIYEYLPESDSDRGGKESRNYSTSWKCKRIIDASRQHGIEFQYDTLRYLIPQYEGEVTVDDSLLTNASISQSDVDVLLSPRMTIRWWLFDSQYMLTDSTGISGEQYYHWKEKEGKRQTPSSVSWGYTLTHCISKIVFDGGHADFHYDRLNERGRLECIRIFAGAPDDTSSLVRAVYFTYRPNPTDNMYQGDLTGITIDGKEHFGIETPECNRGAGFSDFWGYGGYFTNGGIPIVPNQYIHIVFGDGWDYDMVSGGIRFATVDNNGHNDGTMSQMESPRLTVSYPSGGKSVFNYEHDVYRRSQDNTDRSTSSFRIKDIKYYDEDGSMMKAVSYRYGRNGTGKGTIKLQPQFGVTSGNTETEKEVRYYLGTSPGPYNIAATLRRRTYLSKYVHSTGYSDSNPVDYDYVTEYQTEGGKLSGKTVYTFNLQGPSNSYCPPIFCTPRQPYHVEPDYWYAGVKDSLITYKYVPATQQFDWVQRTKYDYSTYYGNLRIHAGRVWQSIAAQLLEGSDPTGVMERNYSQYIFDSSPIKLGCIQLTGESTSLKEDDGAVVSTTTSYGYDSPNHYTANRKATVFPDGKTVTEQTLYAEDYPTSPLMSKNLLSIPIETISRTDGKVIEGATYTFDTFGRPTTASRLEALNLSESGFRLSNKSINGQYEGPGISAYSPDGLYSVRDTIQYDVKGNICEVRKKGEPIICYVWGYSGIYPIAKVVGTSYAELIAALPANFVSDLSTAQSVSPAQLNTLDTLRSSHLGWQVTMATYKPLVGMLRLTDQSGRSTNYEYNNRGHLIRVSDEDGKTVTQYDYSIDK